MKTLNRTKNKAEKAMYATVENMRHHLSFDLQLSIFDTIVRPIMLFGSDSRWADIYKFEFRLTLMTIMFLVIILKINNYITFHLRPGKPFRSCRKKVI